MPKAGCHQRKRGMSARHLGPLWRASAGPHERRTKLKCKMVIMSGGSAPTLCCKLSVAKLWKRGVVLSDGQKLFILVQSTKQPHWWRSVFQLLVTRQEHGTLTWNSKQTVHAKARTKRNQGKIKPTHNHKHKHQGTRRTLDAQAAQVCGRGRLKYTRRQWDTGGAQVGN